MNPGAQILGADVFSTPERGRYAERIARLAAIWKRLSISLL